MGTRIYLRKRSAGRGEIPGIRPAHDITLYTPARLSVTGRASWQRMPWDPGLEFVAQCQKDEAQERLATMAGREALTRVGVPGRPRIHADHGILEYLGLYRHRRRLVESRAMPAEVRARRRYSLLAPEWRHLLTEDEFVQIEKELVRQRHRHNRMRLPWNADTCRAELINEMLRTKKDHTNGNSDSPDRNP